MFFAPIARLVLGLEERQALGGGRGGVGGGEGRRGGEGAGRRGGEGGQGGGGICRRRHFATCAVLANMLMKSERDWGGVGGCVGVVGLRHLG